MDLSLGNSFPAQHVSGELIPQRFGLYLRPLERIAQRLSRKAVAWLANRRVWARRIPMTPGSFEARLTAELDALRGEMLARTGVKIAVGAGSSRVVARTAYAGRRVLGMVDCLWGLLDGVNDAGLAVSLTFGGRPQVGEGFGIPLVIRYVLEVCETVEEAVRVLRRVPVHMSYNVTALDRSGRWATVYLAPDRPARVTDRAVTTNHQGSVEWAPYAAAIRSQEREERLQELLEDGTDADGIVAACLRSPLYATRFHEGFGTLYTAEYRPAEGIARYHWPQRAWEHSLDKVESGSLQLRLGVPQSGAGLQDADQ